MRTRLAALVLTAFLGVAALGKGERKTMEVKLRSRPAPEGTVKTERQEWNPAQTCLIVCDMWDKHWCKGANRRGAELAPRVNQLLLNLRERGVLIIHAPSGCMDFYKDHPGRKLAQSAPTAAHPPNVERWCYKIPAEEKGVYPLDQDDGGCDDLPPCKTYDAWKSEMAALEIKDGDAISDSGIEIWNLMEQRGIKNVLLLGVHLNMCVLGRPFGLRNMATAGKNVALVRDLTDTMYNPKMPPMVGHFEGTRLIVEHIEKYVAPTITSDQIAGGREFRFKGDR